MLAQIYNIKVLVMIIIKLLVARKGITLFQSMRTSLSLFKCILQIIIIMYVQLLNSK